MRTLLLGSAAALLALAPAMAADFDSITVTTELDEACSVNVTDLDVDLPANGDNSDAVSFTYQCNYGGEGSTASISYSSGYGGVSADTGTTDHVYNIVPTTGSSGTSAATLLNATAAVGSPNVDQPASFVLALVSPILVAGTYDDVLTVSIAPN